MIYAITKLVEIELDLERKIKEVNEAEKESDKEIISVIRHELEVQAESVREAISELREIHSNITW